MSKLFEQALKQVSQESKDFIDLSFDIVNQIHVILERQGKTQKDLAILLGKQESEVSKWMRGTHNFTAKSLSKIGTVLGEKVICTPEVAEKEIENHISKTYEKQISLLRTKISIIESSVNQLIDSKFLNEPLSEIQQSELQVTENNDFALAA